MTELLESLRALALRDRLEESRPLLLKETRSSSTCGPVRVDGSADHVALRLGDRDFLPLLNPEAKVRKLPDYLIFADPPASARRRHRHLALQVVICELKSGAAGAEAATAQLRCGRLLARYLIGLAALRIAQGEPADSDDIIKFCGVVVVPQALLRKGVTRPEVMPNRQHDTLSQMPVHRVGDGGIVELDTFIL